MIRFVLRRLLAGLVVLLAISYLSFFTQDLALRTRTKAAVPTATVAVQAWHDTTQLWQAMARGDFGTYAYATGAYGNVRSHDLGQLLWQYLGRSIALLLLAMILGGLVGGIIGLLAAGIRRRGLAMSLLLLSVVGISTPSFFLGMLLQYGEILFYQASGVRLLPVGGFGWDTHMILPVLVLAARPVAQVARLTYVRADEVLEADYVRTARAKGLRRTWIWGRHIIPNVASTVLTAMGTSLRFSLSSLPVVEFLFGWPGAGQALLDMMRSFQREASTVLILVMGALFIVVNILLDLAYRRADPRLAEMSAAPQLSMSPIIWLRTLAAGLWSWLARLGRGEQQAVRRVETAHPVIQPPVPDADALPWWALRLRWRRWRKRDREADTHRWRRWRAAFANPSLWLGGIIALMLAAVAVWGPAWTHTDVYLANPQIWENGVRLVPPLAPSASYPLGTDAQGRDILDLILVGTRRTLIIALFATLARVVIGGALGFLAGWFSGSRLDRAIMGLAEALAAFPTLLLAMLVVYALGIEQGLMVFVAALALVGWGEVMQTVRSQVMAIKPMEYVEGAIATGLSQVRILSAHVLPNVWPSLVSLGFLEMGGALMILGELGFLGVFIGGGFAADGEGIPTLVYYDIPEWSVMLANSWRTFRSYPWATLYPALAFFVAILGFTFLGEGIRWLAERFTLSMRALFNRYSLLASLVILGGVSWSLDSTSFVGRYAASAEQYAVARAVDDVAYLSSADLNGRLSGTADAEQTASWIAAEFEALGLQPAGEVGQGYYQTVSARYRDLTAMPTLVFTSPSGQEIRAVYGQDFVRSSGLGDIGGYGEGELTLVADPEDFGGGWLSAGDMATLYGRPISELERTDRVILWLTNGTTASRYNLGHSGVLTVAARPLSQTQYDLLANSERVVGASVPQVEITAELADRILAANGQSLESLAADRSTEVGLFLPTGWQVEMGVPVAVREGVPVTNVIAYWPGTDVVLDSQAVIVSAYYDGLGRAPDGTLYPGANDNASGVATMLEVVRTLQDQGFAPRRTLIFVAWIGGERHRAVDLSQIMKAHPGFETAYDVVAAIELEGVGAGSGDEPVITYSGRARLSETVQRAAHRLGYSIGTRDPGLHPDPDLWPQPSEDIPCVILSWAGSQENAHLPQDDAAHIDPAKMEAVGRITSLAAMALSTDPAYR